MNKFLISLALFTLSALGYASETAIETSLHHLNATTSVYAILAIIVFILAYSLVIAEEHLHLRKSKPVMLAAGIIWILVALTAKAVEGGSHLVELSLDHNLKEYSALLLFLITAMVYVNAMTDRNIFEALKTWLIKKGFSYRQLFWITGLLAFFISPITNNLTTALLMGTVVLTLGSDKPKFVSIAFINIVVAANAGGIFSPFGDITTLMVWQSGYVSFAGFFGLLIPALVNFLVPAFIMSFAIGKEKPSTSGELVHVKKGGFVICGLFLATTITAVLFEQVLDLPPYLGMMTGLSYLFFYAYYIKRTEKHEGAGKFSEFDIFNKVAKAEWDTLLFFFGVIFCVGGLSVFGYLAAASGIIYDGLGPTYANIIAGVASAIVDNIPVMFAILTMNPEMNTTQWLLVTLTTGVGGSLLAVGSAAGVALMGQSKGMYTFASHMKWSWAIALGFAASIGVHLWIN